MESRAIEEFSLAPDRIIAMADYDPEPLGAYRQEVSTYSFFFFLLYLGERKNPFPLSVHLRLVFSVDIIPVTK